MRNLAKLGILVGALTAIAPAASATGWLVNFEDNIVTFSSFKFGSNVFGGQGDTVDVGLANYQCSDEEDVVDVGVWNREGDTNCAYQYGECPTEEGEDPIGTPAIRGLLGDPATHPHDPHCSDDGDTVDAGVFNDEGSPSPFYCDPRDPYCNAETSGDEEDGVDAGVLNREWNDDDDANDVGVLNCEWFDSHDGNDVGVLNLEYVDYDDGIDVGLLNYEALADGSDTFDASLLNAEDADGPDANGVNVLQGVLGLQFGCGFDVRPPGGPVKPGLLP